MYSNGALFGENEILFIFVVKLKTKENYKGAKMDISLLKEGLFVMTIGMGTVFIFLTVMILVMNLNSIFMQKVINKYFPEELPVEKKSQNNDEEIALAVACAYAKSV